MLDVCNSQGGTSCSDQPRETLGFVVFLNNFSVSAQENQSLKDEINRLKKEHGVPKFPDNSKADKDEEEKEEEATEEEGNKLIKQEEKDKQKKKKRRNHKKGPKKELIPIDDTQVLELNKTDLPSDAVFKYYAELIQQDVDLVRKNVKYKVAVYYSASEKRIIRAPLPCSYVGEFGLGIQSLSQLLHRYCDETHGRLAGLYKSLGVLISAGTISNFLVKDADWAVFEQREILRNGIEYSSYAQIDGTKSVEKGEGKVTQIICGKYFSVFYTLDDKSRLSVLKAIQGNPIGGLQVKYNEVAEHFLTVFQVPQQDKDLLAKLFHSTQQLSLEDFEKNMQQAVPKIVNKPTTYSRIKEAMALGYYHTQTDFPVIEVLLSDAAGEYGKIARYFHGLCWIHDGRYYKKLVPRVQVHRTILTEIQSQYWEFYEQLLDFKKLDKKQQIIQKKRLSKRFDEIFTQTTDYFQVNQCLRRTLNNKDQLLAVLDNPALPLHNNAAELGARRVVRKRDISFHTWSKKGTQVRDAFMTIVETAAKLNVSALSYIKDRISGKYEMTALAELVALAYFYDFTSTF